MNASILKSPKYLDLVAEYEIWKRYGRNPESNFYKLAEYILKQVDETRIAIALRLTSSFKYQKDFFSFRDATIWADNSNRQTSQLYWKDWIVFTDKVEKDPLFQKLKKFWEDMGISTHSINTFLLNEFYFRTLKEERYNYLMSLDEDWLKEELNKILEEIKILEKSL